MLQESNTDFPRSNFRSNRRSLEGRVSRAGIESKLKEKAVKPVRLRLGKILLFSLIPSLFAFSFVLISYYWGYAIKLNAHFLWTIIAVVGVGVLLLIVNLINMLSEEKRLYKASNDSGGMPISSRAKSNKF